MVKVDQDLLDRTLKEIYSTPFGPRHYLTPAQFAQKFGLADKRQRLKDFARGSGLTVDDADDLPSSLVVKAHGPASAVENTFGVQLNHYRLPNGKVYHAHETEPTIPVGLAEHMSAVHGLSNVPDLLQPNYHLPASGVSAQAVGARPSALGGMTGDAGAGMSPADIKNVYYGASSLPKGNGGVTLDGTGQTVALFELDGYNASDIALYEALYGLPNVPLTNVLVDGYSGAAGGNTVEVCLDIEMVMALAPKVSSIIVYEAPNSLSDGVDLYARIASDNLASVLSVSWGLNEPAVGASIMNSENTIFQQMAAQGMTVYIAAGDGGSNPQSVLDTVLDPGAQPYVTSVGGTSLAGSVGAPVETVWNNGGGVGGGGGVSSQWPLPSYQPAAGIGVGGEYSTTHRNVPDVALNADPNSSPYNICVGGSCTTGTPLVGGTSAAAPLWAGFTALINQFRHTFGAGNFGFANPIFYSMGQAGFAPTYTYAKLFNDITVGNNKEGASTLYNAGAGYDNVSGWGSFRASTMVAASYPPAFAPTGPLTAYQVFSSSVALLWSNGNGNGPLTDYRIDYWDYSQGASTTSVITTTTTFYTVTGLIPNDTYFFSVGALGSNGLVPPIPANVAGLLVSAVTNPAVAVSNPIGSGGGTLTFNTGNPNNTLITLSIPPGAFTSPVTVSLAAAGTLPGATSAVGTLTGTGFGAQVNLVPNIEPTGIVSMSLTYQPGGVTGLDPSKFILARYDPASSNWVPLTSSRSGTTVAAYTSHLSLFQIMQSVPSSSVKSVKIFPNPLRPALGHTAMTFINLPANARLRIYTMSGVEVQDLNADATGMASWNGNNLRGMPAASGIYYVFAQDAGNTKTTFKVAIER